MGYHHTPGMLRPWVNEQRKTLRHLKCHLSFSRDASASRELERKIVEKCGEIMVCYNGMFSVHGALPQRHAIYGPKADTIELALALFAQKLWQK